MKTVFLVRHAKSSWDHPGLRDFDRPLGDRGIKDAPKMAAWLAGTGVRPDALVSSTANRALTTAGYFAEAFGIDEKEIREEPAIYEAFTQTIIDLIRAFPDDWQTVLIFGHNPTFTSVANQFSARLDNLPTCGIVRIDGQLSRWSEWSSSRAMVAGIWYPKLFK
ncbi:MAG TPA: histidine phosphatase family protein [Flavilitoribacter sp.]|nr:histidine phosphatase family protein [Flavilitoribacter sp.]HMQ89510.1 histidine phosphatase family protein [Flavilitoribacter sp.]